MAHEPSPAQSRMSLLAHFSDLRARLRNAFLALLLATIACYPYRSVFFRLLAEPLIGSLRKASQSGMVGHIVFTNLLEPFMVLLKTSLVAALFLSSPVVFYQVWKFLSPGLYPRERKWTLPFVLVAFVLFMGGGLFCYHYVLPASYEFFLSAGQNAASELRSSLPIDFLHGEAIVNPMLGMDEYFGLTLTMLVVFGAVFELPLLLAILTLTGVVTAASLWRFNRYAILLFAILGAIVTPGDLVVGQLVMTVILTALYNLSIVFALIVRRKKPNDAAGSK